MASINEKINYINETKGLIKDKLNDLGSEIDNETTFREYAEKIEDLYEEWPKTNDEDIAISLNNTKKAKMNLQLKGNTNQFTTTGKNLYNKYGDFNYPTTAYKDRTTLLDDGTIKTTANNASNSSRGIRLALTQNTRYTISAKLLSSNGSGADSIARIRVMGYSSSWTEITSFGYTEPDLKTKTFNSGSYTDWFISLNANGTIGPDYEAIYDKVQVELGEAATEYEPYTNGAAPNPDYPQNIEIVTGENIIEIKGVNLGKPVFDSHLYMAGRSPDRKVSSFNVATPGQIIKVKPNTNYTINGSFSDFGDSVIRVGEFIDKPKINDKDIGFHYGTSNVTFTTTAQTQYLLVYDIRQRDVTVNDLLICETQYANIFTPYAGISYSINLGNLKLCKYNENYQDYIYKENDKWYMHKEIESIDLDDLTWETRDWGFNGGQLANAKPAPNNNSTANLLCSCFINVTPNNVYHLIGDIDRGIAITMSKDLIARDINILSLENFNSKIQNQKLYYVLETPTNIEITDTTLITQLNILEQAISYNNQTNISQTNNDLPFIISASALLKNSN